jgi:hypothetical protein
MADAAINSVSTYQKVSRILKVYLNGWASLVAGGIGILGNIMNVIVFSHKTMTSSSHVYVCALAVTDLIVISFRLPLTVGYVFEIPSIMTYTGFYAHYLCYMNGVGTSCIVTSIWIIVALSIERFIAISWPLKAKSMCIRSRARKVIPLIYISCFIVNIMGFLRFTCEYVFDKASNTTIFALTRSKITTTQPGSTMFHTMLLLFMNVLPITLLILVNTLLIWRLRQMARARTSLAKDTSSGQNQNRNITILVVAMVVGFIACNFPAAVVNIIVTLFGNAVYGNVVYAVCMRFSNFMIACFPGLDFCLYSIVSSDYRKTLKQILHIREAEATSQTTNVFELSAGSSHGDP